MVGRRVNEQDDAPQGYGLQDLLQFEKAALIGGRKCPEVHEDGVAPVGKLPHRGLPCVGVAKEFVDAMASIRIGERIDAIQPLIKVGFVADELAGKPASYEAEKFMWLDRRADEIGAGNQTDRAAAQPQFRQRVEQPFASASERKDAKQQKGGRPLHLSSVP